MARTGRTVQGTERFIKEMKYRDKRKLGKSKVVPFKSGEPVTARHARRLKKALLHHHTVKMWCDNHRVRLDVSNEGHHWKFVIDGRVAEWWPSSAKLVLEKQYDKGIHCHDFRQLLYVLRSEWLSESFEEK